MLLEGLSSNSVLFPQKAARRHIFPLRLGPVLVVGDESASGVLDFRVRSDVKD